MDTLTLKKSLDYLSKVFIALVAFDIILCWFQNNIDLMYSSIICITGLLLARLLFHYRLFDTGSMLIVATLYLVGFYHVIVIENYITCYLILIMIPSIASLLVYSQILRYSFFILSVFLFPLCNYYAGLPLFENYFFYYGLIPSFLAVLYFIKLLELATLEKEQLINELNDKNEEITLYANMMSHELKAPLGSIAGFSSILERKITDPKDKELFSYITQSVESMKTLIHDLLQFSKTSTSNVQLKSLNLNEILDRVIDTFSYEIGLNQIKIETEELQPIIGHAESIQQALQNIISNGIKYQPKDNTHIPCVCVSQNTTKDHYQVIIRDNGIGIDKSHIEDIFQPFKRLHSANDYEGTGLGMSIVEKIMEKHDGTITLSSEAGKGTSVVLNFPLTN